MPEIPTFTASGNTRGGPVLADTPAEALTAPARALERTGYQIEQAATDVSQLLKQKKQEDDLRWATESAAQFKRVIDERIAADEKAPSETQGIEFKDFADQQLAEYTKNAPSQKAADVFRMHGLSAVEQGYRYSLQSAEKTRLVNADFSNQKATNDLAASIKATAAYDSADNAVADALPIYKTQLASIQTRFGKTMPALAEKMTMDLVKGMAYSTAALKPDFARQIVNGAPIDEASKLTLNSHIDSINSSAMQLQQYNLMTGIKDSFTVAEGKMMAGEPVDVPPPLPKDAFDIFGKESALHYAEYQHAYKEKSEVISAYQGISGLNANAAQGKLNDMLKSGDPQKTDAAGKLQSVVTANAHLQKTDAVQFLENSNDKLKTDAAVIPTLPDDMQPQATQWYYNDLLHYQGHAAPDAPDANKYMGNDIVHILSADKADKLKQELLGGNRDQQLKFIDNFSTRFGGDDKLANIAWHDMIALGKERIPMGLQFAGIINNVQTRKEFMSAQFAANPEAKLDADSTKAYISAIESNGDWNKFATAWKGPALERAGGIEAARMALISYAHTKTVNQTPEQATKEVVQKVILDNYGFAEVHGQPIAIPRISPKGEVRTDDQIKDMSRTLQLALHDIDVRELRLNDEAGRPHYPNFPPNGDVKNPADAQYVQDAITSNGFWVAEPSGETLKLFVAEPGREPFAVLDKTNQPLQFKIDDLPNYYQTSTPAVGLYSPLTEMPLGGSITSPDRAKQTYPLLTTKPLQTKTERFRNYLIAGPFSFLPSLNPQITGETNWPTRGTYFQGTRKFGVE